MSVVVATLASHAAGVPRVQVNTRVPYASADWPSWPSLQSVRDIVGTMNGPREVYPLGGSDKPYDTMAYVESFKELDGFAVRFNDLNFEQGAFNCTSITQIFKAWPTTDAALSTLSASDISALTSNESNFVWDGVDYIVGGACGAGVRLMDFRLGDTWHVTDALNKGEPVPVDAQGASITFPSSWAFPTNVHTQTGIDLWASVAAAVAKHVRSLCDRQELVFDVLTEVYVDSSGKGHFWAYNASVYAQLFGAAGTAIKAAIGADKVRVAGPNVILANSANDHFFSEFLTACYQRGYAGCPLDLVTFHYFSTDPTRSTAFAKTANSAVYSQFHGTEFPVPRMAITAFGLHPNGKYDYYKNVTGAAIVAEHLIALQGVPIEFAVFYKFDGVNCEDLGYPCLVEAYTGRLKAAAEPFVLHSRLLAAGSERLAADLYYCKGGSVLAAAANRSSSSLAILIAGTNSATVPPAQLSVQNWKASCGANQSTLTTTSVSVNGSFGALSETTVAGDFTSGVFHVSGDEYTLPIQVDQNTGYFVALLTLKCGGG